MRYHGDQVSRHPLGYACRFGESSLCCQCQAWTRTWTRCRRTKVGFLLQPTLSFLLSSFVLSSLLPTLVPHLPSATDTGSTYDLLSLAQTISRMWHGMPRHVRRPRPRWTLYFELRTRMLLSPRSRFESSHGPMCALGLLSNRAGAFVWRGRRIRRFDWSLCGCFV